MAQTIDEHTLMSAEGLIPTSPLEDTNSQSVRLKGRKRLLKSIQRISSSPSLALMGRPSSSSGYNGAGRASLSCVSLASPASASYGHSYGSSYPSQFSTLSSAGFSTAPTSLAVTPSGEMGCIDFRSGVQVIENTQLRKGFRTPLSVPIPCDVRFSSVGGDLASAPQMSSVHNDYFSIPIAEPKSKPFPRRANFNFWKDMPDELKVEILRYLKPKEIVRCSGVSQQWHKMCFDGQLWTNLNASEFYRDIPSGSLIKILTSAGPFVKDLNLRGCVQLRDRWGVDNHKITEVCRNIEYFSIEGCRIDRTSVHFFLLRNTRLVHINFSGIQTLNNSAMKIIAQNCPRLEYLDVSWCQYVDTKGLQKVVQACPRLKDLRAAEIKGFDDQAFLQDLFEQNSLERLLVSHCTDFDDDSLLTLIQGKDPEVDVLSGRTIVPPRTFRHLDFSRCKNLTDKSVKHMAHKVPALAGLRLSQCTNLTDDALVGILETAPCLTHLDLEELDLKNETLLAISKAPCATRLTHLNVSYCENLGDTGMIPVIQRCRSLRAIEMDNTHVSDLALIEAAALIHERNRHATVGNPSGKPALGLRLVAYDCQNVTWTGVREVLSRNGEFFRRVHGSTAPTYPKEIISLKCFYGYQPTVAEHTKRVLRGELARATLLERKWAEYMVATEEAGAQGSGWRRRRRRAREAERIHAHEQDELARGGRRRARSGGCVVM